MVEFKLVIGDPKTGKCIQKVTSNKRLVGMKIGEAIKGELVDLNGYEFIITGGSDYCGFPMRKDVDGFARKKILAVSGTGLKKKAKGIRVRKTVCGNTIHPKIVQVNLKILTEGKEPLTPPSQKQEEKKAE